MSDKNKTQELIQEKLLPIKVDHEGSLYVEGIEDTTALSIEVINKKLYLNCMVCHEIEEEYLDKDWDDEDTINTYNVFKELGTGTRRKLNLNHEDVYEEEYPYVNDYDRTNLVEIFKNDR